MPNKLFLIILLVLFFPPLTYAQVFQLPRYIKNQNPVCIDISSLTSFFDTLCPDEKEEQVRDWALYGILSKLGISQDKISELLQGSIPMRYSFLKDKIKNEILPGRISYITQKDCIILVPYNNLDNKSLIGSLLDRKYARTNLIPKSVHIFSYKYTPLTSILSHATSAPGMEGIGKGECETDFSSCTVTVTYNRTIPSNAVFSEEYSYFQKEIKNINDFNLLTGSIDDITLVKWEQQSLVLGGRKYPPESARSLSPEDIAALYQAYNIRLTPEQEKQSRQEYEAFVEKQYAGALKRNSRMRKAIESGNVKKSQILDEIRRQITYSMFIDRDSNVGFSLDTEFDCNALADDLVKVSTKDAGVVPLQNAALLSMIDLNSASIISTAEELRKKNDLEPLLVLMRRFDNPGASDADKMFMDLLKKLEARNSYQVARYDGPLQGTSPGMILFYTDFTAKLWALDFNGLAPFNSVTGFRTMSQIKVPKLYWDDFIKLSKTRLWFGLRQEGFEVYGKKLLFESIATRVYAASSSPLFPGKESTPNFQSAEFLGWWDNHFLAVADYEPQYHKLNQIQKWSAILAILKEEKNHSLDFLFDVPVQKNNDFEQWYRDTVYLRSKTHIAFLDRKKYNKTVECLPLFYSIAYPLMGQNFYLYGGVSLASKKDILQKLGRMPAAVSPGGTGAPSDRKVATAGKKTGKPMPSAPAPGLPQSILVSQDKIKVNLNCRLNKLNYGSLKIDMKDDKIIKFTWEKGAGTLINELLGNFVDAQQSRKPGYKDESIFKLIPAVKSVFRIENWKTYLVKCDSIKNSWVYLALNENPETPGYLVKAAGTEPDSDMFFGKLISDIQADRLTKEKQATKIF